MALTVVSKPSGFQPVGGGVLNYVWTEASLVGKVNYRVEIIFNGLGLPTFEARPDASLTVTFDVAAALRSALKLTELVADRLKNTYVQYQAKWDASSDGQVNLNADVIYFYIGNNHFLNKRSQNNLVLDSGNGYGLIHNKLSNLCELTVWNDRVAYFEFLCNGGLTTNGFILIKGQTVNDADMVANIGTGFLFDGTIKQLVSSYFYPKNNLKIEVKSSPQGKVSINETDIVNGFSLNTIAVAQTFVLTQVGTFSDYSLVLYCFLGNPDGVQDITITTLGTIAGVPNNADVKGSASYSLRNLPAGKDIQLRVPLPGSLTNGITYAYTIKYTTTYLGGGGISFKHANAALYAGGDKYNETAGWVLEANRDIASYIYRGGSTANVPINLICATPCENPVHIRFLNQFGGLSQWLFDFNQELTLIPQSFGRYLTKLLFADQLSYQDWLLLNELNVDGVEYNDNYKIGQYAVDITDETNILPVVINEKADKTLSKRTQHSLSLVARYPLIPPVSI